MKKIIIILFVCFCTRGFAQAPANDNCTGATNLGTLGTPGACTGTTQQNGAVATSTGTITNATPENPYVTEAPCSGGTQASPANDVWYTYVAPANGFGVKIVVTSTFANPNIALWTGSCTGMQGVTCAIGTAGTATINVTSELVPGQTYYIQVSGNTGQTGTFTIKANALIDCSGCLESSSLTVSPLPVNGMYQPGQTVSFCFHVAEWMETGDNWLDGVQMYFGAGWDTTTIVATAPATLYNTGGHWAYYSSGITSADCNCHWQSGFYFAASGGTAGHTYGDGGSDGLDTQTASEWKFCWTIQVGATCNPGSSLSVTVSTSGDGESGEYSTPGCGGDASTTFDAVQSCCPPTMSAINVLCNGGSTGDVTANAVIGGAGDQDPYTFVWTGPSSQTNTVTTGVSNTFSNVPAGTYTVVVTDKNLCSATNTVTVTQPTVISSAANPHNISCAATGSITTTAATGGTSPYTYTWAGPGAYTSATQSPTGLTTAGVYTLTVTDHNNCTFTTTASVAQTGTITVTVNSPTVCAGGSVTLTGAGATTYSWSTGVTTAAISPSPGTTTSYTVIGTTGTCTNSAVSTVGITATPTVTVGSATICPGGTATLTATGATTYSWNTGATTASITQSPSATTSYTVTGTTNTCTNIAVATITIGSGLTITANSATICPGVTATLTAVGATNYTWTPVATLSSGTGTSVTATPTANTTYTVVGATGACSGTVTTNVVIGGSITITSNTATICTGGTATLTAAGATNYTWTPSATLSSGTGTSVTAHPTSNTTYTITGATGSCTGTVTTNVVVNPLPTVTATGTTICTGNSGGISAANAITYTWIPMATLSNPNVSNPSADPTSTTDYTVTGTDANGCVNTATTVVTVNLNPTITVNNPSICSSDTATLTAAGATTYSWSTGVTTNPITVMPSSATSYTVIGTTNTCTNSAVATVSIAAGLTITSNTATICSGSTAILTAAGATNYTWAPSATLSSGTGTSVTANPTTNTTYSITGATGTCTGSVTTNVAVNPLPTVTATGTTICTGNSGGISAANVVTYTWTPTATLSNPNVSNPTANPTATTDYTVTGTDANGCVNTATTVVTVNPLPNITATGTTICIGNSGGIATANAITCTWTPSGTLSSPNGTNVIANPTTTTDYIVTGTDVNGCVNTATTVVTVNPLPTITATSVSICPTFAGTITAGGANTYTWSTGITGANLTQTPPITTSYTVTGTDLNTCTNTAVGTIAIYNTFGISVNSVAICATGQQTGTLTANGAATYVWSPATGLSSSTGSMVTTSPSAVSTTYTITGTSAVGSCTASTTSILTVNPLPLPVATSNTPCVSQQPLNLSCTPAGLSYSWTGPNAFSSTSQNPTIATANVTTTIAGIYTIAVIDGNNCTNTVTINVTVNPLPLITTVGSTICIGQTINLSCLPNGNTYSWSGPGGYTSSSQTPSLSPATTTMAGNYAVVVTNPANGCFSGDVATVVVNTLPIVTVNSSTICAGQTATLTANGASTYVWSPSNTLSNSIGNPIIGFPTPIGSNTYIVTGTNNNNCVSTATTSILVNPLPVVNISSVTPDCIPLSPVFTATSTPPASSYNWNFGNGQGSTLANPNPSYTVAGTFPVTLTVKDIDGCVGTASTSVTAFAIPIADFTYGQQPVTILNPNVQFYNQSTPGLPYYNWNFGDIYSSNGNDTSTLVNPSYNYTSVVGTYSVTLTVSTISGCSATVTLPVVINDAYSLYVPNAFTPNGDGKNEVFKAVGEGINTFALYIFDRWGLLLFYSSDINKGWDGTYQAKGTQILQEDVYVWKIEATDILNTQRNLHGTVTLVK